MVESEKTQAKPWYLKPKLKSVGFEGPGVLQWSEQGEEGGYRHKAKLEAGEGLCLEVGQFKWYRFEPTIRVGDTGMEI